MPAFAAVPENPKAAKLYAEALKSLRLFDALAARNLLKKALVVDPNDPLIRAALADTLSILGYDLKAQDEARRAFELSGNLPREQQLLIEALDAELSNDWDRAMKMYHALLVFYPKNFEISLRMALSLTHSGKAHRALELLEGLRKLPPPASEDPRIDLAEALAADALRISC